MLQARPNIKELTFGNSDTFFLNTTHVLEGIKGYCWWKSSGVAWTALLAPEPHLAVPPLRCG